MAGVPAQQSSLTPAYPSMLQVTSGAISYTRGSSG
jgi:hypothetical protein